MHAVRLREGSRRLFVHLVLDSISTVQRRQVVRAREIVLCVSERRDEGGCRVWCRAVTVYSRARVSSMLRCCAVGCIAADVASQRVVPPGPTSTIGGDS